MVPSKNFSRQYFASDIRRIVKSLLLRGLTKDDTIYFYHSDGAAWSPSDNSTLRALL